MVTDSSSMLHPQKRRSSANISRREGQRSKRHKNDRLITKGQVENIFDSLNHAAHIGLLPTHHITLDWEVAGVADPGAATGQLLKYMKDSARRYGVQLAHIWVQEQGRVLGRHVHLLIHVPLKLKNWLQRNLSVWLKRCGAKRKKGVRRTNKIQGSNSIFSSFEPRSDWYKSNLERVVQYVLKHCDPSAADTLGRRSEGPTDVIGKHVSVSQNIGPTARKRCQICTCVEG